MMNNYPKLNTFTALKFKSSNLVKLQMMSI